MSSAGSIDSQSIKTAHQPGPKGFDTGKPVNGRQRPCLVDTLGMIDLEVVKGPVLPYYPVDGSSNAPFCLTVELPPA